MCGRSHAIQIGVNAAFSVGVVSCVFVVEVRQPEIVVNATVDVMTEYRDSVRDLKNANSGPELIWFVNRETLRLSKSANGFQICG